VCYVVGGSEKALLSLVDLGCIAIHVMNSRVTSLQRPDWLAFDLDPSSGSFRDAAKAGRLLHGILEELRLRSYPKTSGARGLHVFVPLRPGPDQGVVRAFARDVVSARASSFAHARGPRGRFPGRYGCERIALVVRSPQLKRRCIRWHVVGFGHGA
jgi:bifunctional non-homologous end joining protein LigD